MQEYQIVNATELDGKFTDIADKVRVLSDTEETMSVSDISFNINQANENVETQTEIISRIRNALVNKTSGVKETQKKFVTIEENGVTEILPDTDKLLSSVEVTVAVPIDSDNKELIDQIAMLESINSALQTKNNNLQAKVDELEDTIENGQEILVQITENGKQKITPDSGKVLKSVEVDVNVNAVNNEHENWYDFTIELNQPCSTGKQLLDALTPSLSDMVSGSDIAICTLQNENKKTLTPDSSAGQALQCYIYKDGNDFAGTVSKYRYKEKLVNPALMTSSSAITPYYPCTYYVKIIHLFDKGAAI